MTVPAGFGNSPFRLLCVHSDLPLQAVLAAMLQRACTVLTVTDVAQATSMARTIQPDLVLLERTQVSGSDRVFLEQLIAAATSVLLLPSRPVGFDHDALSIEHRLGNSQLPVYFDPIVNGIAEMAAWHGKHLFFRRWDRRLSRVLDSIYLNHGRACTVARLAEVCSVSAQHLGVLFRERTGMTLSSYVIGMRIELVKRLLRHSCAGLEAVAERAGFCDASHMSRTFLKEVGCGPGAFRRRCAASENSKLDYPVLV